MSIFKWSKANVTLLVTGITLLLILFMTSPLSVPVIVLVIPPLLIFLLLSVICYKCFGLSSRMRRAPRRRLLYSLFCAATPAVLLVLASISQLTLRDFILTISFISLAVFYLGRFSVPSVSKD